MINIDFLPIKYITGTYRYDETYPTDTDLLWDIVNTGKKTIDVEFVDWIEEELKSQLIKSLLEKKYIKINNNKITIIKTDWDGWSDQ